MSIKDIEDEMERIALDALTSGFSVNSNFGKRFTDDYEENMKTIAHLDDMFKLIRMLCNEIEKLQKSLDTNTTSL